MAFAFLLNEKIHQNIDFPACHITFVSKLDQTYGLRAHRCIHHADLRHVQQCNATPELLVKERSPALQLSTGLFRVVAQGVSIVPSWNS